jgi:murein tripeptide amidase MpaA
MDHYLNEAEMLSAMQNLAAAYPDDCALVTLPHATYENRTVRALRIGRQTAAPTTVFDRKIGVLFTGSAHAREWGGADILIYLASDLLKAYAANKGLTYAVPGKGAGVTFTASQIQLLRERVDLFLVPCVNPDGRAYSMSTAPLWRKNRNPASSGGAASKVGVDINRNFDFLWDFRKAFAPSTHTASSMASDDPADDTFRGVAPHSEPETRNVVHLFASHPQIAYFVDIHSYTGDVLYPWGDAPNQSVDPAQNFLNPAYDGVRGVDNLAVYGEYVSDAQWAASIDLAGRITDTINAVTGEGYATTQSFYLAPGSPGGTPGTTFPTGGVSDDYATSRARAVPGASPVLGFTLEFHRYGGADHAFGYHPPFPKMAGIIAEADAGLIAFCLAAELRSRPVVHIPELFGRVTYGVTVDGGGIVWVNGVPKPVPPWDPLLPSLLRALQVYTDAYDLPVRRREEVRRVALKAMQDVIEQAGRTKGPA